MRFLIETTDNVEIIEEVDPKTNKKSLYLEGITLQGDIVNQNRRKYPMQILREAVTSYCDKMLAEQRAVGELNHPTENIHQINPDRISHRFVSVTESGSNFITKALVLNTTCGIQVKNLIEGGVKLGMSGRALGKTRQESGIALVEKLHIVSLADIVYDPSAPQAFSQAIYENKEWIFENGVLVGKDIEPFMDETKKALANSTPKQREDAMISVFEEFLHKISLK